MSYAMYSPTMSKANENGYSWYECNCCPYGYHIDLDFVRYCESISHEADNRTGSIKRRKDRRRQRQSMEVLLGLTPPIIAVLEQNYKNKAHLVPYKKPPNFPFSTDSFDDAVSDFERTLQRSKNKLSNNLPDVTAVSDNIRRAPSVSSMSSASGSSLTVLPTGQDGPARHDFDAVSIESCGLSPMALQNIREQMALSLERTKQLEDQVKLLPELKLGHYFKKEPPPPPPRKDFGVMCGVLTRNIGVGHQNPNTRSVSTTTFENEFADKWLHEKVKFLNNQNLLNTYATKKLTLDKFTETLELAREKRDVGIQLVLEKQKTPPSKISCYSQTTEIRKILKHIGVAVVPKVSDFCAQKYMECYSIGCSDDTIDDVICEKCNAFKRSVAVGPDSNEDTHTSPISLASLSSRSKSFNLGDDRLNLSTRTRTVASQYEPNSVSKGCQSNIKLRMSTKSCQHELKLVEKNTQYEKYTTSRVTDTTDLIVPKRHVACEAKESKSSTCDAACNTTAESAVQSKCDKEKDDHKDVKKDGGSPTPSRIPRPQIPTTPVENRKFRRQDTYTKVYSSPTEKTPTSPLPRLSGLDLSPKCLSNETSPLDKVKQNFKLTEVASSTSHAQNGVNTNIVTKVQIQETTLPTSESTIFSSVAQSQNRKNLITANPLDVEDYLDAFEDMSSLLLEYIVNMTDSSGNTAMHYAVSHGNFDVVSILLDSKVCDINKPNKAGYTSVMLVSLAKLGLKPTQMLFEDYFNWLMLIYVPNRRITDHGQTALMLAVSHGRLDMVKMLLEAGADVNIQDEDGSTALMCAAEHGHIEIVKHFLSHPECDSSITDVDGSTALKIAMEAGHRHIGVLLYAHKRNNQKNPSTKLKKTKSVSPKTPSSPLPVRSSHRALTDTNK
ncbi:hypothetical protein NQ318_020348 [Aromia moschata]|uniref:KN motif and ankyrin repeat domain-containing protein 2 n=1 Tax=Aromia moschata TaxID=1265417 RepID=A0AAV8XH70_9CUCU|nr:hypothetical protein NQ318_020348 [Aromia moschata]